MKIFPLLTILFVAFFFSPSISQSINTTNIYFAKDAYHLDDLSDTALDDLTDQLQLFNEYKIEILGHTDQDGSPDYNIALSKKRADAVASFFKNKGAEESDIRVNYFGEAQLISNSTDESDKLKNRRVTVSIEGYTYNNVNQIIDLLETPDTDLYHVEAIEESTLSLSKGTDVNIPANAFCHLDGTPVTGGMVELTFKEAFDYSKMINEHLVTETIDQQLLETGGMIYISASLNGEELRLQDGTSIELLFPEQKGKSGMELFLGAEENGNVAWTETGEQIKSIEEKEDLFIQVDLSPIIDFDFDESEVAFPYFEELMDYPHPKKKANPPYAGNYSKEKYEELYKEYEEIMAAYKQDELERPEKLKQWHAEVAKRKEALKLHRESIITKKIYNRLRVITSRLDAKKDDFSHEQLLVDAYSFLQKNIGRVPYQKDFYMKKMFGEKVYDVLQNTELKFRNFEEMNASVFCKDFMDAYTEVLNRITDKKYEMGYVDKEVLSRYVVRTSNLGWINCDRFIELAEDEKTDLEFARLSTDEEFYLVFKNIKSVIRPRVVDNKVVFYNVPKGEDVRLVGFSYKNNSGYLATQDLVIGSNQEVELSFKQQGIAAMRQAISSI